MVVPTFTSIDPEFGTAGGRNLATIIGTNFRVPTTPGHSVEVAFNGVNALNVDVLSTTTLRVSVPPFRGEGSVAYANPLSAIDIKISNLDDDGVVIVGEEVTEAGGYTYRRAPVRDPRGQIANQIYRQIIYETIWTFQRQLLPNVAIGTSVDYGGSGATTAKKATLPNATLVGPRLEEDMETRHMWEGYREDDDDDMMYWPAWVSAFEFDIVLATNRKREMYGMIQGLNALFMRTPFLQVPITLGSPNDGFHKFPLVLVAAPSTVLQEPNSDLVTSTALFQVQRIPFELDEAVDVLEEILEGELSTYPNIALTGTPELITFADSD